MTYFRVITTWGRFMKKKGDHDNAIVFFQKAMNSIDHVDESTRAMLMAIGYNNMGRAYEAQRKMDPAFKNYQKAYGVFEPIFGTDHLYSGIITNNSGSALLHQGHYDEALLYFEKAHTIFKTHGDDHPRVALTHINL